jgi:transcription antitermination protein NusB
MPYKRRLAREKTLQALYAIELSGDPPDTVAGNTLEELRRDDEAYLFALTLFRKSLQSKDEIDGMIRTLVDNWEFERIALIDKLLLRMTICELLYFEEIPPKVSINEAIEIAKRFSTEKSDKFVNGILDAVLELLKKENRLHKSGRGLIDISVHNPNPKEPNKKTP